MREFVEFNPENKEHRAAYNVFLTTGSWGKIPVRFVARSAGTANLLGYMQRGLLEYYTQREFKNEEL